MNVIVYSSPPPPVRCVEMSMWTWASCRFRTQFTNPISVRMKSKSHPRSKLGQSKKTRSAESWTLRVVSATACASRGRAVSGRPRQSPKHAKVSLTSPSWLRLRTVDTANRQRDSPRHGWGVNIAPARAMATTDHYDVEFRQRLAAALGDAYELRDLLGRGGFAVVYAALARELKREVAV